MRILLSVTPVRSTAPPGAAGPGTGAGVRRCHRRPGTAGAARRRRRRPRPACRPLPPVAPAERPAAQPDAAGDEPLRAAGPETGVDDPPAGGAGEAAPVPAAPVAGARRGRAGAGGRRRRRSRRGIGPGWPAAGLAAGGGRVARRRGRPSCPYPTLAFWPQAAKRGERYDRRSRATQRLDGRQTFDGRRVMSSPWWIRSDVRRRGRRAGRGPRLRPPSRRRTGDGRPPGPRTTPMRTARPTATGTSRAVGAGTRSQKPTVGRPGDRGLGQGRGWDQEQEAEGGDQEQAAEGQSAPRRPGRFRARSCGMTANDTRRSLTAQRALGAAEYTAAAPGQRPVRPPRWTPNPAAPRGRPGPGAPGRQAIWCVQASP